MVHDIIAVVLRQINGKHNDGPFIHVRGNVLDFDLDKNIYAKNGFELKELYILKRNNEQSLILRIH